MKRSKGRVLSFVLAAAMLLTSVPGTAFAAEPADTGDTSADSYIVSTEIEPVEDAEEEPAVEEEAPEEGTEAVKVEEPAGEADDEASEPAEGPVEEQEKEQEDKEEENIEAEEGSSGTEAPEAGSDEDEPEAEQSEPAEESVEETEVEEELAADGETAAPAEEEKEPEEKKEEIAMGRFALRFDSEGGIVKVIVSTDEGANEDDPSYELEKSGGSVRVQERNGNAYDASMAEGYALDIETEAGARITVIADAAEGFHVSEYSVTADAGGEEGTGFDNGEGRFSHTASVPGDGRKVFSVGFEQDEVKAENGTVTVKVGSSGGTVTVTAGGEVYTIVKPGKGDAVVTDRSGREIASADGNFDLAIEDEVGKTVTVRAVADKGFQVTAFTVAGTDGNAEASSFNAEEAPAEFEQQVVIADGRKAVNVSFVDMPEFNAEKKAGKYIVKIHADEGVLPRWARVSVKEMKEADAKPYAEKAEEMADAGVAVAVFDITFTDFWGREIQPNGMVEVTFENAVEENAAMSVYHAPEGDAAKMEEVRAEEKDDAVSFKMDSFSPVVLLAAAPEPNWTKGGAGTQKDVSSNVKITSYDGHYYSYDYEGRGYGSWQTPSYTATLNSGETVGFTVCMDPRLGGEVSDMAGLKVYEMDAPMLVKAFYYGAYGPGSATIQGITGSTNAGANNIVTHVAAAEIYARLGYAYKSAAGDGFTDTTNKLKEHVKAFVSEIEDKPVPDDYYVYIVVYDNNTQDFGFGSFTLVPHPGSFTLRKIPDDPSRTVREQIMANSNYNMAGAVYCVYKSTADAAADKNRVADVNTKRTTITIKDDGTSDPFTVDPGTYYVKEVKAPTKGGYQISGTASPVTVKSGGTSDPVVVTVSEPYKFVYLRIKKEKSKEGPSLAGAVFNIYSDMKCEPSSLIGTLTTDARGYTEQLKEDSKGHKLLIQNYYAKEITPPVGYKPLNSRLTIETSQVLAEEDRYQLIDRVVVNTPISAGINIHKESDNPDMTDDNESYTLAGAKFGVYKSSDDGLVEEIVTDENGYAEMTKELAAGTDYYIKELEAPDGFAINEEIVEVSGADLAQNPTVEITVKETPKFDPAQISIVKRSADGKEGDLSGAEFTFSYYDRFLDEEGLASASPKRSWTIKTKKFGDEYSARFNTCVEDGTFVSGDEFYIDGAGNPAFPLGTVTIEETRAPEGFQNDPDFGNGAKMLIGHVELNEAGRARFNVISGMDPVENTITVKDTPEPVPEIGTTLVNAEDGTHIVPADTDVELVDTVSYEDVTPGNTYTVTGTLMDKSTRKALQYNGKDVTATATFKADKAEGTVDVTFTFNTADLGGKSLVAFEQLSCDGKVVASHEEWDDKGQTVDVIPNTPEIRTSAIDAESRSHMAYAGQGSFRIIDTVSYWNLKKNTDYTMYGTLMDKETKAPFKDENGNEVKASAKFNSGSEKDGTVDVVFEFSCSEDEIKGHTLVVKEELKADDTNEDYENIEGAEHWDPEDREQTIYFPETGTTLINKADGTHVVPADADVELTDTVSYKNVIPGETYTVTGTLMDKSTRKALQYNGKDVTATATFKADKAEGTMDVTFTFNTTGFGGKTLVAFEQLSCSGRAIAKHEDWDDEGQTVTVKPNVLITTTLVNAEDGTHLVPADSDVELKDTISYEGVTPGETYTAEGTLMDKSTGRPFQAGGKNVTATVTFKPEKAEGTVETTFSFNTRGLNGKELVAFEVLRNGDEVVATHEDLDDKGQTVHVPTIETDAYDDVTGEQNIPAARDEVFTDKVTCTNLIPGKAYEVSGEVKIKPDDGSTDFDGAETVPSEIVAAKADWGTISYDKDKVTFVPAAVTGTDDEVVSGVIYISFKVDSSEMAGESLVVGETERYNGKIIAVHRDINDDRQTPKVPKIGTSLVNKEDGTKVVTADTEVTLVDTVTYENVLPGKSYTVSGSLMDTSTRGVLRYNGKDVTAEASFVPEAPEGTVEVSFTFNTKGMDSKTLVAFEELTLHGEEGDEVVASHKVWTDKGQTVTIPGIETDAYDDVTGKQNIPAAEDEVFIDKVTCTTLVPGETYEISGEVKIKPDDSSIDFDAAETVPSEIVGAKADWGTISYDKDKVTFVPAAVTGAEDEVVSGVIYISFKVDSSELAGESLVVGETERYNGKVVAVHRDINDERQTPKVPKIGTTLVEKESKGHLVLAGSDVELVDTVSYENVIPDETYEVIGTLIDKSTGKAFQVDGRDVTATASFKAENTDGTVDVAFTFNTKGLEGKTLVAYEQLLLDSVVVARHEDIDDKEQTVAIPKIGTTLVDGESGEHLVLADADVTLKDTVAYENLIAGETYDVTGTLMDKSTGKALQHDGRDVTATASFKAENADGTADVTFTFNTKGLEGKTLVAFEELACSGYLVAEHKDLDDEDQTVVIPGVETDLYDGETEEKNTLAAEDRVIVDKVSYEGLIPGKTYEVSGEVKIKPDDGSNDFDGAETVPSEIVGARSDNGSVSFDKEKVTFTPAGNDGETVSGFLYVSFKVDASELAGEELVVGETATYNGVKIAVHRDISDKRQADYVPDGETMAVDTATGIKNTLAAENRVFKDTFRYEGLLPGKTYRFTGKVMADAGTDDEGHGLLEEIPSVMTDADGKPVDNGYVEFVPEEADGTLDLYFAIDATALENRDVTVFERVSLNGKPVIIHEVLDGTQTIYVPEGRTTAVDLETQDQVSMPDEEASIIDTLVYKNLIPGTEYTVKGRVMRKTTGDEIESTLTEAVYAEGSSGSVSVAESVVTFTPEQEDGALKLTFVFGASELAGEDVVVFERVYHNGSEVIVHENIDDEAQTVHFPDGCTFASDPDTDDRTMKAGGPVIIRDEFVYENLLTDRQYAVTGKVMLKPTDDEEAEELEAQMVDAEGNPIDEYVFTPETKNGSEFIYFQIDSTGLEGRSIVMFEKMEYINPELEVRAEIVRHEDIDDEDETIHFPDGGTKATDSDTGDHVARADESVTINDEVTYRNLIVGKMYAVTGVLMDKETGEPLTIDGEKVTAEKQFVAETAEGSVFIEFTFNGVSLAGKTVVAFETMTSGGKEVFVHADIDDEEQTVHFPDGGTKATDKETGSHTSYADEDVTIIDEVIFRNVIPGMEYKVTGTLMDKATGKPLTAGGKEVTSEKTFVPDTADGSVFIEFTFNGVKLAGRAIVAFETMSHEGTPVFVHADLDDRDQTVNFPEVHTTATDMKDGDHEISYEGTVTIVDDVEYKNLTPGIKYRVSGLLMDKATGNVAKAGVKEISGEAEFTAKEKDGTVQVKFTFDSSKLKEGSYVVFETLYEISAETGKPEIVGAHWDLEDQAQTVRRPKPPTPPRVRTGDDNNVGMWVIALVAATAGIAGAVVFRRRRFRK